MSFRQNLLLSFWIIITLCANAQTEVPQITDTTAVLSASQSSKYLDIVSNKANKLEQKLDKQSAKALQQMQKLEKRIGGKLARLDSNKAKEIFGNAELQYQQLEQRLEKGLPLQNYIGPLDSISTSLKFLQQNSVHSATKETRQKLKDAMSKVSGIEGKFQKAEEIKKFIRQRKILLRNELGSLGFTKELKKISKTGYYFSQQVNEYASLIKDHRKAERRALQLLSNSKLFQKFFQKESRLASLFRMPDLSSTGGVGGGSLAGLQTRASVNNLIQSQTAVSGPGAMSQFQQNLGEAQSKINEIKNKISQFGGSSSDDDMPENFIANPEKVKSFIKRVELSINIQSQKANNIFPTRSDIGISIGYKINRRSIAGIGASYQVGWGQNIRHIKITHQGVGIRSFIDWKIKGSFWLSGGYERNYRSEIRNIEQLKDKTGWQNSGLVGISKIVSLKPKFFKKTKLSLMWDFLSYSQIPKVSQPIVFRIGYNF